MHLALDLPPGTEQNEALHLARKATRRARYSAEAARPVLGEQSRQLAKQMKKLQDALGVQHDRVVIGEAIEQLAASARLAGESTITFDMLHELETRDAAAAVAEVRATWEQIDEARQPEWMR
jgi:CHAD domain-containing protein